MICPNDGMTLVMRDGDIMHCPLCPFNVPKNKKLMETMFAWVSVDPDGLEGFMAAEIVPGVKMVLCHSEYEKAVGLENIARKAISGMPGWTTRLIKFSKREVVS